MRGAPISQDEYLKAAQYFHWATKEHFIMWLMGEDGRHRRTEVMLPRLSKKTKRGRSLVAVKYGKRLVYSCPRKVRNPRHITLIPHGLGCTETLVRLYRANMTTIPIEERFFKKSGCRPEFGLWYPSGTMILAEFSTAHDFHYSNRMNKKLSAYKAHLWEIEAKFKVKKTVILFVFDVPREEVQQFVLSIMPVGLPVYFTDYESFKAVPIGEALSTSIYFWGEDGQSYPLTNDV